MKAAAELTLQGNAQSNGDIIELMRKLGQVPTLRDVRLVECQAPAQTDAVHTVKFKLTGYVAQAE